MWGQIFSAITTYNKRQMLGINTQEEDIFTEFDLEIDMESMF